MGDDQATIPRPLANVLTEAREGRLAIGLNPEDFVYIDRDCNFFKDQIRDIQQIVDDVSRQEHWGLGETNDRMISARTLVARFKEKAKGAGDGNSVWQIMEQHYRIVEDIQEVHRLVRERMMQEDSAFAARFTELNVSLPERPPPPLPPLPRWSNR